MEVPDYQTMMTPVLRALEDGVARHRFEVRDHVAQELRLTDDALRLRLKSGGNLFGSRVWWAITYLYQARLLDRPRRGVVQITARGLEALRAHPERVDNEVLSTFPEFLEFKGRSKPRLPPGTPDGETGQRTPEETIAAAVQETNEAVASELLLRIRERPPEFLERLVLSLLNAMGYGGGSVEHLGRSGDEGLDGVIRQDALGLDRIYVQAKRYSDSRAIGRPDIQGFVGALHGAQADRGVFITTSRFSQDAIDYAAKVQAQVVLVDGRLLGALLVEHNVGVQAAQAYVLKRVDEDFFDE